MAFRLIATEQKKTISAQSQNDLIGPNNNNNNNNSDEREKKNIDNFRFVYFRY